MTGNPEQKTIAHGYCHCGCGQKTEIAKSGRHECGWIKGEPKAYTRTNTRGTVSHIEQKGAPEQPVTIQAANPGKRYAIPPPPAADQQRTAAAAMVKPEMTLAQIRAAIETQHVSTEDFIGDLEPGQTTILRTTTGDTQRVKIVPEGRVPNPALAKPIRRTKA